MNKRICLRHLLLLLSLVTPLPLPADILSIPVGDQGDPHIVLPTRGDSQKAVLERFGLPDEEHPAEGKPPITRWDYREFSVYFESGVVVDAVRQHRSQYLKDLSPTPKEPQ